MVAVKRLAKRGDRHAPLWEEVKFVSKRSLAVFSSTLFTGLFFVFGLEYGVDPSDAKGTIISELILVLFPQAEPYLSAVELLLAFFSFLGFIALVRDEWDRDWQMGAAAACGLLAGALTLLSAPASIPFWIIGVVNSAVS